MAFSQAGSINRQVVKTIAPEENDWIFLGDSKTVVMIKKKKSKITYGP
jgi:hypothetical protein